MALALVYGTEGLLAPPGTALNTLYELLLAQTSAMKLSAPRLRVGSDDGPFEAAVVLHEAARIEARAVASLGPVDAATRLRAAVERCGTLLEAGDATTVVREAWPQALEVAEALPAEVARLHLWAVEPTVRRLLDALDEMVERWPHLAQLQAALSGQGRAPVGALRRELHAYLKRFPGDGAAWLYLALVEWRLAKDVDAAWVAVTRLRRLEPQLDAAMLVELGVAIEVLPSSELRERLRPLVTELGAGRGSAPLALVVAAGFVRLGREPSARPDDLDLAEAAARHGLFSSRGARGARPLLRAVLAFIEDARAGRPLGEEVFRRVGLPELARTGADPLLFLHRAPVDLPALAV